MTPNRMVLAALFFAAGCDPSTPPPEPPPSARKAEPEPAAEGAARPRTKPSASRTPQAVKAKIMKTEVVAVRRIGDTVEIEVELDRPLSHGGLSRPTLQVGDETATRSRAGEGGRADRLVFTVASDQYERMPKGADIIVRAGLASNEDAATKPKLADAPLQGDRP